MIKKYFEFINENIGEYIESVSKDDDYLLNIISEYTKNIDPTIRIAKAIDTLNSNEQNSLLKQVKDYINGVEQPQDIDVLTSVEIDMLEENVGGKHIFKSFLKIITALGLKESNPDWINTTDDFLLYYQYNKIEPEKLKTLLLRFKSLSMFSNLINDICCLYYGIKCDMTFEYGFLTDKKNPIGSFKLNNTTLKHLILLDSPSSNSLKKEIVGLDIRKISLFCKIKNAVTDFKPGYHELKMRPIIKDSIITFGYNGISGNYIKTSLDNIGITYYKKIFKDFLSKFKWADQIQIGVNSINNILYLNIKIK